MCVCTLQAIKEPEGDEHTIVTVENPAAVTTEENNFAYEVKVRQECTHAHTGIAFLLIHFI